MEKTLIFLKPDIYKKKLLGKVIHDVEQKFSIVAMQLFQLNKKKVEEFYSMHKGKDFFQDLTTYISSGPIVAMVLQGEDIIARVREFMGNTDPKKASKNSLRGKYGESFSSNVIHGSDSKESAKREMLFFFPNITS